jgi:F0F1-type ATP synthase assembly protein I
VAFLLLGGIAVGAGIGAGIDWLARTFPLFTVIGVFAGFALALYAIYLETK